MLAKKKDMSFFQTFELIKVNARIAEISEDLEKLKSEKERQILLIGVGSDEGVKRSKARIGAEQDKLWKAEEAEAQYSDDLNMAAEEFHKLEAQAANFDPDELMNDRLALRMQEEQCAVSMLKENYARECDMSMIRVENLTFAYPSSYDNIFENVNFQIDTDWKLGFVGRNGRGKTTFLNLLLGKYPRLSIAKQAPVLEPVKINIPLSFQKKDQLTSILHTLNQHVFISCKKPVQKRSVYDLNKEFEELFVTHFFRG